MMSEFAFERCRPILIAPPAGSGTGRANNGSGFVLKLQDRYYVGTAWHVVKSWLDRTAAGERLLFQFGHADLPPRDRFVWRCEADDISFFQIDESDVDRIGLAPCEPSNGWPPPRPSVGEGLLIAGYPGTLREHAPDESIDFGSYVGSFNATTVDQGHLYCQFQREHWVCGEGREEPPVGADLGGMSGGPVFLIQNLAYPLVGMISQHNSAFEIMKVHTFAHLPSELESSRAV